ncbi:hypothetical protein J7E62_24590 [Variovorax paradoxus]|nr:hypothetical protein [Variovorax paradoxus]
MSDISTCSKYIDGRAVERRIDELEGEILDYEEEAVEAGWTFTQSSSGIWIANGPEVEGTPGSQYTDEDRNVVVLDAAYEAGARFAHLVDVEELDDLRQLREEAQGYGGWPNCTLVNEDNWVEYAQQTADDLGGVTDSWPHRHIDWDAAADELKQDYTEVRYGGSSFLMRA